MAGRYVTFTVAGGLYALPVAAVAQIVRREGISAVPAAPEFVDGVVTHGGEVVPVVNLRLRFGLPRSEPDRRTRMVVVEKEGKSFGLVVDRVREVVELSEEEIAAAPETAFGVRPEFVLGVAGAGREPLVILDIFRILSAPAEAPVRV